VSLYLNTLLCQDPETWGALRDVIDARGWSLGPTGPHA
jgi:hypothetical protein